MEAAEILRGLRARGLRTELKEGILFVGPRSLLDDELREMITARRAELIAHLASDDEAVRWRLAVMIDQLFRVEQPGPVPVLVASAAVESSSEGTCFSCGELLGADAGDQQSCGGCARARAIAIELWLARPAGQVLAA